MAERKKPRKLKPANLKDSALFYLGRYAASTVRLRQVMTRRIRRSALAHEFDPAPLLAELETVIAALIRSGVLNDVTFAEAKTRSLRRRGGSSRQISAKLAAAGVKPPVAADALARFSEEIPDAEFTAALAYAKRRRLGTYRIPVDNSEERRNKDMAAMARAGFSYDLAKRALKVGND